MSDRRLYVEAARKAWIISIGNELLTGKIVNTNASWIAKKLTIMGFKVSKILIIPDISEIIIDTYREAIKNADIIISTGGLGPTFDDKTSEALSKALHRNWVINKDAFNEVKSKFTAAGMELTKERLKMAKMPEGAISLKNIAGIAPGILVKQDNKLIIALPGVPKEMKAIFEEELEKLLFEVAPSKHYFDMTIRILGIPESTLAPYIDKLVKKYPNIYFKSHPKGHETGESIIEMHVSTYNNDDKKVEEDFNRIREDIRKIVSLNNGKLNENM